MTGRLVQAAVGLFILMLLAGCSTAPSQQQGKGQFEPQASEQQHKETIYFVRSGDTLAAIGRRFGVTSTQIQYRNGIGDPRTLKIGARLVIPDQQYREARAVNQWTRFIWPLKNLDVSSEFGTRSGRHKGIDLRAPRGTSIYAAADGVVYFAGRQRGYGNVIIIKHAGNIKTLYAHNEKNMVSKGQQIRQGELIATVGRTGKASGNHLHFEYAQGRQRLNPRDYIAK